MTDPDPANLQAYKDELIEQATRGGALVAGVADVEDFHMAPEGHRPTDLLPGARAVFVVGGAQPRAADWRSPKAEHMETTPTSDRISALALKLCHHVERKFGHYTTPQRKTPPDRNFEPERKFGHYTTPQNGESPNRCQVKAVELCVADQERSKRCRQSQHGNRTQ